MAITTDFPLILKKLRCNDPAQTSIDLVGKRISSDKIKELAEALAYNFIVTSLSFSDVNIDNRGVTELAKAVEKNSTLITIKICSSPAYSRDLLIYEGIKAIATALKKNNSLVSIDLNGILMDTECVLALSEMLIKNATLASIKLCLFRINHESINALLEAVEKNSALTTISFADATFSSENIQTLKRLIEKNSNLSSINLYHWRTAEIDENEAVRILSTALESNMTLTSLVLGSEKIADEGIQAIAKMLEKNRTLTSINLSSGGYTKGKISAIGLNALAKALEKNTTLTSFDCYDNPDKEEYFPQIEAAINRNKKISAIANPALESLQRILDIKERPSTEEELNEIAKQCSNVDEARNKIKHLHPSASQLDQIQEGRLKIAAKHAWLIEPEAAFELFDELNEDQKIADKNQNALEMIAWNYYAEINSEAGYSYSKLLGFMLKNWYNNHKEQQTEHLLRQCLYRCINGKALQSASLAIEPTVLLEALATNSNKLPRILQEVPGVNKIIEAIIYDAEKPDPVKSIASAALVRNKIKEFGTDLEQFFDLLSKVTEYSKILDKKSSKTAKNKANALMGIVSACSDPHQIPNFNSILGVIHQEKKTIRQHRHWSVFSCFFPLFQSKLEKRVTSYKMVTDLEKHIENLQARNAIL